MIGSRTESGGIALPGQDGDVRVRRHEVRQEAVSFLDAVVVVRNRFARLDDTVLGGRHIRGHAAREPRRVEPHLVEIVFAGEGGDVAEGPVAALLRGDRLAPRVLREVQAGKDRGRDGRDNRNDGERYVRGFHAAFLLRTSLP